MRRIAFASIFPNRFVALFAAIRRCRMAGTCFAVTLLVVSSAGAQANDRMIVRVRSALPDSVASVLMDVGRPANQRLDPGIDGEMAMRSFCGGSVTNQYRLRFIALNGGPGALLATTKAWPDRVFPACAHVQRNVDVAVEPTDTPAKLLSRELGPADK